MTCPGHAPQAEVEQAEAGDDSALHVIVFDEIDAFTRERGSLSGDTSGIRDSVVNQARSASSERWRVSRSHAPR